MPSSPRQRFHRLWPVAAALLLGGCIVVPQTQVVYDPECRVQRREVTLETVVLGGFYGCVDRDCALMLATAGVVTAASAVVSGSIALVGNMVYWLELQGRCDRETAVPARPSLPPTPHATPPVTQPATPPAAASAVLPGPQRS